MLTSKTRHGVDECDVFMALSNKARAAVVQALAETDELSVSAISELVEQSHSNAYQHLSLLRKVGLVTAERRSNETFYRLAASPGLEPAYGLLDAVFARLDRNPT